ncbi:hypothetical protein SARC_01047 [Sphaeroforma arctica JP610]|uniref:Uncharacterized protein n=1 Tax=Sphaeroforma arctica JP610 TaxID=667725 RepID=A0A0L0GCS3_9EUKA|nr:hypothetical protein SARC_01047 [Sphaeroforma arctica JP610]KNC86815.1 hypothetical protein SARC_01047 [Sphaeroforma arctica JP610]|eukprot:XP_014160717.1 hypothetical protein SARC_01047 [Sphaeroforma arctica JP610]
MSDINQEDLAPFVRNQNCGDYPVWKKDPYHIPFYEDEHITLYTGTIPPNTATGYHQHNKDTFYVVLATGLATNDIVESKEIEPEHKPRLTSPYSGRVSPLEATSHFGSGLTYKLQPGDKISLPQYKSTDAPLTRVVVHLAGDWTKLEITAPSTAVKNLRTEGNKKRIIDKDVLVAVLEGHDVFVADDAKGVADVEYNGPCQLTNTSDSVWEGVVVDVFGKE